MSPDLRSQRQLGIIACALALLVAVGLPCWVWWGAEESVARLAKSKEKASVLRGPQPLRTRVAQQRSANDALLANIAELKTQTGFRTAPPYRVPPGSAEPGRFFSDTWTSVRETLRKKCEARRIEPDEYLGFPKSDLAPADAVVAQELLNILQITEKALNIAFDAPEPIESFTISHAKPDSSSMPLLREYPITLRVRGSLKTILWILHSIGSRVENKPPLILRGLEISSVNKKPKDDIQILDATFDLAAMAFPAPASASSAPNGAAARPANAADSAIRARP